MGQALGCLEKPKAEGAEKPEGGEEGKYLLNDDGEAVGAVAVRGEDGEEEGGVGDEEPLVVLDAVLFGERYELRDVIGRGITSTVHLCERVDGCKTAPRRCACKLVDKRKLAADPSLRDHLNEQLANEIGLLARLQHPNIVKLFDVYDSDDKMYIVMELMTGGELFDHIIDKGTLSEAEAAGVIKQVASSLAYCHKQGVVHRDLKPENLLLGKGSSLDRVKIADFGFAKDWSGASMVSFIGTPGYLAPELRQGSSYSETVDVWALGVILYVLLSGRLPFAADTAPIPQGKGKAQEHLKLEFPENEFQHVSTSVKELVYHMLMLDPADRITAQQVLDHPWVRGQTAGDTKRSTARLKSLRRLKRHGNYSCFVDSPKAKKLGFQPSPRGGAGKSNGKSKRRSIYNEEDDDANEHVVCSPTSQTLETRRGVLRFAHFSQRGFDPENLQRPNTDCFATVTNFNTDSELTFFGVFDGHGESARACARFSRDQLQKRLARRMNKGATFHTALRTAFLDTNELLHKSPIDDTMSGATAVVVVVRHGVLEIANVGDTRAILAEEETAADGTTKLVAKPLSTDQTAYREDERARVRKEGARVLTTDQLEGLDDDEEEPQAINPAEEIDTSGDPPRVWAEDGDYPGTTFTRSIGDSASERLGLVADPELESCPLSPRTRFVVLGSDGLFEFLTSQAVVDIVSQFDDPLEACRAVVSQAYSLWLQCEVRIDNITCICVFIDEVPVDEDEPQSPRTPRTLQAEASLSRPVRSGPSRAMRKRLSITSQTAQADADAAAKEAAAKADAEAEAEAYKPEDHVVKKGKKEMKRLANACKAIIMFQNLEEAQRKILFSVMQRVSVAGGQKIIAQHDEGDCCYVVDNGSYEVRVDPTGDREDGGEVVHGYADAGHFGELALMYAQPRAASVFCTSENGSLWKLDARAFRQLVVPNSESLGRVLRFTGRHRAGCAAWRVDFGAGGAGGAQQGQGKAAGKGKATTKTEGGGVSDEEALAFLKEKDSHAVFGLLCAAEPHSPSKLYAFFQPPEEQDENGDAVESNAPSQLFFGSGEEGGRLRGPCCFFRRVASVSVDLSLHSDATLVFGVIDEAPLRGLQVTLTALVQPMLEATKPWGKADAAFVADFKGEMGAVVKTLAEARRSQVDRIELEAPAARFMPDKDREEGTGPSDEEMVLHFETLLVSWCDKVGACLDDKDGAATANLGPASEHEFWHQRYNQLASVIAQLKEPGLQLVVRVLAKVAKTPTEARDETLVALRRWRQIDSQITEAVNEANDNVKFLRTLDKFMPSVYGADPAAVIAILPGLVSAIKMIHTVSRYFNSAKRMTTLFSKFTTQMVTCCCRYVTRGGEYDDLWERDPAELIEEMTVCLRLNDAFREAFREAKKELHGNPKGPQFDFNETWLFGKFDKFAHRLLKLIDVFNTVQQFQRLTMHAELEGIDALGAHFDRIVEELCEAKHDLLDYTDGGFDRDIVPFQAGVAEVEAQLQIFIDVRFERSSNIEESLSLLLKFKSVLRAESLKADLDSKYSVIFKHYSMRLEQVQDMYERMKHAPPIARNMPPVAGNIAFARLLLRRIEEPIKRFGADNAVLATDEGQRVVRNFNKLARTLIAFEYLWHDAWVKAIDAAKAGLQATLLIRHPDDGKLYVNFDQEILQLIRESKCLERMGFELPEDAKFVLMEENRLKNYYGDLVYMLHEYDELVDLVKPVTAGLLQPHFNDMENKLRPGMMALTWSSMNIDAFKHHVHGGLLKLKELVANINDIIDNRVERVIKSVGRTLMIDLPRQESCTLESYLARQAVHMEKTKQDLVSKNTLIETAVQDMLNLATSYPLEASVGSVSKDEILKILTHFNHMLYQSLLQATKNSINTIKKRVKTAGGSFICLEGALFQVDVQLSIPSVRCSPALDDVQRAINKSVFNMLHSLKALYDWGQSSVDTEEKATFHERITKDIDIVKVTLLLTGTMHGLKGRVDTSLSDYMQYSWLWTQDKARAYELFLRRKPTLDDYEHELERFGTVESEISKIRAFDNIGPLSMNTRNLKLQLLHEASQWRVKYSEKLYKQAGQSMQDMQEYLRNTTGRLQRDAVDIDSLSFVMDVLTEVRKRESDVDREIAPVLNMYAMLERFLPDGFMKQAELDSRSILRHKWMELFDLAEVKTDELAELQIGFKAKLQRDVKNLAVDSMKFRNKFETHGPVAKGISPAEAVTRLRQSKDEWAVLKHKADMYERGEALFALPKTSYPGLEKTNKDIQLLDKLYGLYSDVIQTAEQWRETKWEQISGKLEGMTEQVESFSLRCRRMPSKLREWSAYDELKTKIDGFENIIPLLQALSKESVMARHWGEVMRVMGTTFNVEGSEFKLHTLLDSDILQYAEEIEDITDGADKQLGIEKKLGDIKELWAVRDFEMLPWRDGGIHILSAVTPLIEDLEDAQMNLQTMLTMRHIGPFREEAQLKLELLSNTCDNLELWLKVQMMWCSLEAVFTGGDIAKQLPLEARKFAKVTKDWSQIMNQTKQMRNVVACCGNELLNTHLPTMYSELQRCQKSLDGYLEQKRSVFPRFYFVSDPSLLLVLSQGSDPLSMNQHYEKVFDSLTHVEHDRNDKSKITAMFSGPQAALKVTFDGHVKAKGNIEEWLLEVVRTMKVSLKSICKNCAADIHDAGSDISKLRAFVDAYVPQFALLGIQMMWTADVQEALENCKANKQGVKDVDKKTVAVLKELSSWCLQDLGPKVNRKKIETLVTVHVHQRDAMAELYTLYRTKKISDPNDFEWLKQTRFYWRPDRADEQGAGGAAVVSITDVDFNYQFEYLGAKERLVITPLTDRCYITLAQALGMYYGGAPAGPAGTGKTETVKDLGCTLGIYVVVTNCTDQQKYTDCAKIFKGLCSGGLWGCFDEFNRIQLPVLSVVAQQVLAVQTAKKTASEYFQFPGDPQNILLNAVCGFFITMNPGYAGRQELPENLKALFRGVAMMVPNREIIMKVKLCSVGYERFTPLAKKFFILYGTSEQQLSKQKHYDFGLRNILSVLRTAGKTKRDNLDTSEDILLYQTLRDMNLSKLVAQDVPLFLSLLSDIFPGVASPAKGVYPKVQSALTRRIQSAGLIQHDSWVSKIIQLYETTLVRHGIMLVGPAGGGKSAVIEMLRQAVADVTEIVHKAVRFNPKAVRAAELYGEIDRLSGEWTTGVFAALWKKCNNRKNSHNSWIVADGPVDAIWIEDLNTVLDDNKILTLANGDRMPMTDNVKIIFEVESLANASPATVSRAGIIFVSDTDLDWDPVVAAWLERRPEYQADVLRDMFESWLGENTPTDPGHLFAFILRRLNPTMTQTRVGYISSLLSLLTGVLDNADEGEDVDAADSAKSPDLLRKSFVFALAWTLGGLLDSDHRVQLNEYLRELDQNGSMPTMKKGETVFDFRVDIATESWERWEAPAWHCPETEVLDFSNLLVPTVDATRVINVMDTLHKQRTPVALVGQPGTAKTSCALMFFEGFDDTMLLKRTSFSSATTPGMFQITIDSELDKRGGKSFGPPRGCKMTVMLDDLSMPLVNDWGDQPTLELGRLLIEQGGYYFLDTDKRGDFKSCEDLLYVAAMAQPGGGRNDIPNRLKRQFVLLNMSAPSLTVIDNIYGNMLTTRFKSSKFTASADAVVKQLTRATIECWNTMRAKMLPTPAKFHYVFNLRDLSRVFQGVLSTSTVTVATGGWQVENRVMKQIPVPQLLVSLWKHECERVFADKLVSLQDKEFLSKAVEEAASKSFGDVAKQSPPDVLMVDFLRDDVYDDDGVFISEAPKIYEPGGSLEDVRLRVQQFMDQHNEETKSQKMSLILFDDALRHLMRITRLVGMPRGSGLLVGVGGSGKQSLSRLASYICGATCFQITMTKQYNSAALMDDFRALYRTAGHQGKPVVFIFTDAVIKEEAFLEYMNTFLMTGELPGLFASDEIIGMTADIAGDFKKFRPHLAESQDNLRKYFIERVRDNLHIMLCLSPVHPLFSLRARRFPGLFSVPTIDWFLPWPSEALVSVSRGYLESHEMECSTATKDNLILHTGRVHELVVKTCEEYQAKCGKHIFQTPKSYLSFLELYRNTYTAKLEEIREKEHRVNMGLNKLIEGAADVEKMKVVLADEKVKLEVATQETATMLEGLQVSSQQAKKEEDKVAEIKLKCEQDAVRIAKEKADCEADLALAQPFVDEAETAIASIKPAHIGEIKKLANPSDIIKLVFDCVLVLFMRPTAPIKLAELVVAKKDVHFIETSFKPYALSMMGDSAFLKRIQDFGRVGKDRMNEETIELLQPYLDQEGFTPAVAKNASAAAEGLCTWVGAMKSYYHAAKVVKPKLEALAIAEGNMEAANAALAAAESRLDGVRARLGELQAQFEKQMSEKARIENGAAALARKMTQAENLIGGLSGEQARWGEDSKNFAELKRRLVGDCAVACAFISYLGPFNQEFREYCVEEKFIPDCESKAVPVTPHLDVAGFLVDAATVGDWNIERLPTDLLSTQNGIMVTKSSRYPLLVDPQGQALVWIRNRESERLPSWGTTVINAPKLKDQLEFCMAEGLAMIITGVEEAVDPLFDPVLNKNIVVKGKSKQILMSDKSCDFDDKFALYLFTRLPNPHFSPELQAQTTVVDFTVTMKGLEEQLLGRVIGKEQKELEDSLALVLAEVNANTKSLLALDAMLLQRLTSNDGNLLDDEELVGVLRETKAKAEEVNEKLVAADATKKSINEKREQFRAAATRGSVLYFSIVDISPVNPMYQISLDQFLALFMKSMDDAEKAALASKRVENISRTMTYSTYRYVNRGLYERDKLAFLMILTLKILITAELLSLGDIALVTRGGAALDINSVPKKPGAWLADEAWLNAVEVAKGCRFFSALTRELASNEGQWKAWYEDNRPEALAVPGYEEALESSGELAPFYKLLIVRTLRMDRTILATQDFIRNSSAMGGEFVEPITDTIESIYSEMVAPVPVIFLLSAGADPTNSIIELARKQKVAPPAVVSLGEGQEPVGTNAMQVAAKEGGWVLLQNCELGLGLMNEMEGLMADLSPTLDPAFRLFITALPHPDFPLGVLQMCTKVTNEPPSGLRASMSRWYTVVVTTDRLERIETKQWRQLLYSCCFLHSVVSERRKFGALGWCIPYEYNTGDLTTCIQFLEKHLYVGDISWPTVQYMVCEAIYGGKITDDLDRRLFLLFGKRCMSPAVCVESFTFSPADPVQPLPGDFNYRIPDSQDIVEYRKFCASLPEIDSPELFGLHPNADLTFRVKEANALLGIMGATQPKTSSSAGGVSREESVKAQAAELQGRVPADYVEDEYRRQLDKLGGLAEPLNICLLQEVQRLQAVIGKVRHMLAQLQLAIQGEVVMTEELQQALDAMHQAKVPKTWLLTIGGDEFSWLLPTLGLWFASLLSRDDQYRKWLAKARPSSFWLTGFFNPQGFLTAVKQEVGRKHRKDAWALDDLVYHTEVTAYDADKVRKGPPEGVYIHGLFMDGAAWSKRPGCIVEAQPKQLFAPIPAILVTANTQKNEAADRKRVHGAAGSYDCPTYKYPCRTDRYFIFSATLPCGDMAPSHWGLRGLALVASTDF
eukprot:g194.t1